MRRLALIAWWLGDRREPKPNRLDARTARRLVLWAIILAAVIYLLVMGALGAAGN